MGFVDVVHRCMSRIRGRRSGSFSRSEVLQLARGFLTLAWLLARKQGNGRGLIPAA